MSGRSWYFVYIFIYHQNQLFIDLQVQQQPPLKSHDGSEGTVFRGHGLQFRWVHTGKLRWGLLGCACFSSGVESPTLQNKKQGNAFWNLQHLFWPSCCEYLAWTSTPFPINNCKWARQLWQAQLSMDHPRAKSFSSRICTKWIRLMDVREAVPSTQGHVGNVPSIASPCHLWF